MREFDASNAQPALKIENKKVQAPVLSSTQKYHFESLEHSELITKTFLETIPKITEDTRSSAKITEE